MFRRARIRLTVLYIGLFAVVLGLFSLAFYAGFAIVLAPTFDVGAELTSEQVAGLAYHAAVDRIGLALIAADGLVIALVGVFAWVLAARTLGPIREAHARQRRFVADASHEMRTPLTAILSSAEGALAVATTADELRRALVVNATSARRLSRLTNDLLLLARSDEPPVERRVAFDLSVLVAETVATFQSAHPDLARARIALQSDLLVLGDPTEIDRIVLNLLDNAFRYVGGSKDDSVRVTTKAVDREIIVEVADDGPGIAASDLERIFEPFHRVHSDAGAPDGSGLGLAIGRTLAERNQGTLTAVSRPGSGAVFRLVLPRLT